MMALAASAPVPVDVQVEAGDDARAQELRGYMLARVVEQGEAAVPPTAPGAVHVTIRADGQWLVVDVPTESGVTQVSVAPGPSEAVQRLELVHQVSEEISRLRDVARPPLELRTVAVQLHASMPPENYQRVVEAVLVELLDHDVVVVDAEASPDLRVCIGPAGRGFVAQGSPGSATCDAAWARLPTEAPGPLLDQLGPLLAEPEAGPDTAPVGPPRDDPSPPPTKSWLWLSAEGGVVVRPPGVDPGASVDLTLAQARGFGGRIGASVWPTADATNTFVDTQLFAGAVASIPAGRRVTFGLGIDAGVLMHTYVVGDDRGSRVDGSLAAHGRVAFRLVDQLHLGLSVSGGTATRSRRHLEGRDTLWHRSAPRFTAGLGLSYRWGFS